MPDLWYMLGVVAVIVGAAILRQFERGRLLLASAKTTATLRGVAAALDKSKDDVYATGSVEDADVLRDLTRKIAAELVPAGLANHLDEFLAAHGLNAKPKLRETRRLVKPEPTDG